MFCPKCGVDNADGSKFCRACGINISLVPQALSGQLPQEQNQQHDDLSMWSSRKNRIRGHSSLSYGVSKLFVGIAFLIVAIALSNTPFGWSWWFWMLIPAFGALGKGIGEIIQVVKGDKKNFLPQSQQGQKSFQSPQQVNSLPRHTTEFVTPPPSITENTTRHLGGEMPTKVFEERK